MFRIPSDKMPKPLKECTNTADKASPSEKNRSVSWVVDNRVPALPTIATGVKVSSSACDSAKLTPHL